MYAYLGSRLYICVFIYRYIYTYIHRFRTHSIYLSVCLSASLSVGVWESVFIQAGDSDGTRLLQTETLPKHCRASHYPLSNR